MPEPIVGAVLSFYHKYDSLFAYFLTDMNIDVSYTVRIWRAQRVAWHRRTALEGPQQFYGIVFRAGHPFTISNGSASSALNSLYPPYPEKIRGRIESVAHQGLSLPKDAHDSCLPGYSNFHALPLSDSRPKHIHYVL